MGVQKPMAQSHLPQQPADVSSSKPVTDPQMGKAGKEASIDVASGRSLWLSFLVSISHNKHHKLRRKNSQDADLIDAFYIIKGKNNQCNIHVAQKV